MPRVSTPETTEQQQFVDVCRLNGVQLFSVPNGAHVQSGRYGRYPLLQRLKNEGMMAGAPDLICIALAPIDMRPVAIEFKRAHGGRLSDAQRFFQRMMSDAGWHYIVARGCENGFDQLNALGFSIWTR